MVLLLMVNTACSSNKGQTLRKVETIPEEKAHERIFTEEDVKERLLRQLSDEVRIYDVVEHQEAFRTSIDTQMAGKPMDQLESVVKDIVIEHMDAYWEERVRELLAEENEWYEESDVTWILDRISTEDLYDLIVLYEATYYKAYKGKTQ